MQYFAIGVAFICFGLSAFVLKKYPSMKSYHAALERKYTITNKKTLIFLDGCLYFLSGVFLMICGKVYLPLVIGILVLIIVLYFVVRNRLLNKK